MTYHLRGDTLAGIKQSMLFEKRSMATQPLLAAVTRLNAYEAASPGKVSPDMEAVKFYYGNHVFSLLCQQFGLHEVLPEPAAAAARYYVKMSSDLVVRLAYYCLLITTREARHLPNKHVLSSVQANHGLAVTQFLADNLGESEAANKLRNNPPKTALGPYVSALAQVFFDVAAGWPGSYGGPKWGVVTETLRQMVYGEITPEMFADTGFTLAHNGGPIFDKGHLYTGWTQRLYRILDVQRSGQVPQLWNEEPQTVADTGADFKGFVDLAKQVLPEALAGDVDWHKVIPPAGADRSYFAEKEKQGKKAGHVVPADDKKYFVAPDEYVTMYNRKAAA